MYLTLRNGDSLEIKRARPAMYLWQVQLKSGELKMIDAGTILDFSDVPHYIAPPNGNQSLHDKIIQP